MSAGSVLGRRRIVPVLLAAFAIAVCGSHARPVWAQTESSPEQAREEVRKALDHGGYDWYDAATDGPNFERLAHELDDPDAAAKKWRWLAWLLDFVAFSLLISILGYVIRAARGVRLEAPRRDTPAPAAPPPETLPLEDPSLGFDPAAWLAAANEAAARGDYSRAIVCLFNAELLVLDRSHAIRLGPGRTNRHYLADLTVPAPAPESFASAIRTFESVFYGGRGATRESFERFQDHHRRLLESVASARSGARSA